jgi:hypothetical protein
MTDEELREHYRRAVRARRPSARTTCPPPEALLAVVERSGSDDTRLATLDHAMSCNAGCARELELLRALHAAGGSVRSSRARPGWRWMVSAAAAVLLLAFGLQRASPRRPETPLLRGGPSAVQLAAPADGASLPRDGLLLAWHPVSGARRYVVEVLDRDGAVLLARSTTDTSVTAAVPSLGIGTYRWWVRVTDGEGVERQSAVRRIVIGGPSPGE